MLQLHLSGQQFYCPLRCVLYQRLGYSYVNTVLLLWQPVTMGYITLVSISGTTLCCPVCKSSYCKLSVHYSTSYKSWHPVFTTIIIFTMGDKTISDIDLPHQGLMDSYNPALSIPWLLMTWYRLHWINIVSRPMEIPIPEKIVFILKRGPGSMYPRQWLIKEIE